MDTDATVGSGKAGTPAEGDRIRLEISPRFFTTLGSEDGLLEHFLRKPRRSTRTMPSPARRPMLCLH